MVKYRLNRIAAARWFFCLLGVLFVTRLFYIQIIRHPWYQAMAEGKLAAFIERQTPQRGEIIVLDGSEDDERVSIAMNQKTYVVFAEPPKVTEERETAKTLAKVLELEEKEVLSKLLGKDDLYVPFKHFVTEEIVETLRKEKFAGVGFSPEMKRLYPEKTVFGTVTGFLGYRGDRRVGQYGLEEFYEQTLAGIIPSLVWEDEKEMNQGIGGGKGATIVTTLNKTVQQKACEFLARGVEDTESEGGGLVVMDPVTGHVKAMCSMPSYDPNTYSVTDPSFFRNSSVSLSYEPGSVFKPITMAAAIDSGAVESSTEFEDTGSVKFGKFTIRNAENKIHGKVNMTEVLEQSINTGAIFAMQQMGLGTFEKYVKGFGFGQKTMIDIAGEDPGNISSLEKHKEIFSATGSFGQGILVTPLQLARAFSALANKGKLPTPTLVQALIHNNGTEQERAVKESVQVISQRTADIVSAMLASVVNLGHSKGASILGYFIAGKTGTAQVVNIGQTGYSEDTIHTFAGFFPLRKPRFVIVVKIAKPKKGKFAESTAVPVFRNVAEFLLQYYKIPPDKQTE